jgi:uncharacterized RDD family membrane protein YckC
MKSAGQQSADCAASHACEAVPEKALELQQAGESDGGAWRQEIAVRLNRYQARRKPRPPRYPSLRLRFEQNFERNEAPELAHLTGSNPTEPAVVAQPFPHASLQISHNALALDGFAEAAEANPSAADETEQAISLDPSEAHVIANAASGAKIIEFPRPWIPPARPAHELAEPVVPSPRILEVPDFVPPPPALGGITIEPAKQVEIERRPGIDFPLQSASLKRRILAAAIDGIIIGLAGFAFGFIFWKMTALQPPRLQVIEMAAGFWALFWAGYQYLLIVYSGSTPGLRLARLELARFDGIPASRGLRRWRVLASFLSATSLALGYAWVFLDEDALCWHDRITHTYLAPKRRNAEANLAAASR